MLIYPDRGNTIKAVLSMNKFITGSHDYFDTVFQATPRLVATLAIDIRSTTIDMTSSRDSFPCDGAAARIS